MCDREPIKDYPPPMDAETLEALRVGVHSVGDDRVMWFFEFLVRLSCFSESGFCFVSFMGCGPQLSVE